MQSKLEIKAIKKRTKDMVQNSEKLFGVNGNQSKGYSPNDEYSINGDDSKKGGEETASLVDHLHLFDLTVGGDNEDIKARKRQIEYTIPGVDRYDVSNTYSDADSGECGDFNYGKIDMDKNEGQVIIY